MNKENSLNFTVDTEQVLQGIGNKDLRAGVKLLIDMKYEGKQQLILPDDIRKLALTCVKRRDHQFDDIALALLVGGVEACPETPVQPQAIWAECQADTESLPASIVVAAQLCHSIGTLAMGFVSGTKRPPNAEDINEAELKGRGIEMGGVVLAALEVLTDELDWPNEYVEFVEARALRVFPEIYDLDTPELPDFAGKPVQRKYGFAP